MSALRSRFFFFSSRIWLKLPAIGDVADAVDAVRVRERRLPVGPRVGRRAEAVGGDAAEGVVEVGQAGRGARLLQLRELEVAAVDAPLGEVADLVVARLVRVTVTGLSSRGHAGDGDGDGRGHSDEAAGKSAHEPSRGGIEIDAKETVKKVS
jgi:hypothetical protein